jgi:hypothetical protein
MNMSELIGKQHLNSKLVKAILLKRWNKVRQLIMSTGGALQVKEQLDSGVTVLGIALSCDPPSDIIETMLKIESINSLKVDNLGMLPLHLACINGASQECVKLVLENDGGACAQAIDNMKKAPLHYAMEYICDPSGNAFSADEYLEDASPMSISNGTPPSSLLKGKRPSAGNNSNSSTMTMTQDKFHEQLGVLQMLLLASPDIVMYSDATGRTPIDILQDCKADSKRGSRWERADICCDILRKVAVREYREQKLVYEMQRQSCLKRCQAQSNVPGVAAASNGSSSGASTGFSSSLSRMEVDATGFNRMDISCGSGSYCENKLGGNSKKGRRPKRLQNVGEDKNIRVSSSIAMDTGL